MGKTVVLAEKPSVAREIARVIGARNQIGGAFSGGNYIVTWALGHLVTLADPEKYDKRYEKWSLETLPMLPDKMQLVVIPETAKQFNIVRSHLKDASEVVIATDAGREGELVARWILIKAGYRGVVKRLWISSQTDLAIRQGFAKLRPGAEYFNLFKSAECRATADWLVGINVTRALTCKYNAQLSAGRVQTPTLSMIVAREEEIRRFKPQDYYVITAQTEGFLLAHQDRISSLERADGVIKKITGAKAKIVGVKREMKREAPPLLYDLTELQRDANRKYGMSAKDTLGAMQRLYETHKALTYPRTDSRYISADIVPTLRERLRAVSFGAYDAHASAILKKGIFASRRFVDDSKVTDHHAIIPTEEQVDMIRLNNDERRIFDLVVKRFIAVMNADFEYEQTSVIAEIVGEKFRAKGKIIKNMGWRAVYQNQNFVEDSEGEDTEELREQSLPSLATGQQFAVTRVNKKTGKTKPPSRYTEATLLTAMEHPGKYIDNAQLRDIVDTAGGIGTPATRADIIEKLFLSSYIERRGKEIFPLSKGMQLVEIVPEDLRSAELTALWEKRLTAISRGGESASGFIDEMKKYASKLTGAVIMSQGTYRHDNLTRTRCPMCDKFLLEVNGKRGKMLVCQDRDCGYRENLSYISNARCPTCHKKLEVAGEGEKKLYFCKCGFREKFDKFNARLAENRNSMGKRDVERYMQKQQSDKPEVSAFAAAWAKAQNEDK